MDERDSMRWAWRAGALAALVIGWVFIAWKNHFHITAPVVFVCLGFLAMVTTVYNLWRTGASAVSASEDDDDSTWAKPSGELGELERERRTLLKAMKEAEFDQQMGKLSDRDANDMIATYKARIYEVYSEIDRLKLGVAGSKREQILREVRARIEVDARSQKKAGGKASAPVVAGTSQKKSADKARKPGPQPKAANGTLPGAAVETAHVADAEPGAPESAVAGEARAAAASAPQTAAEVAAETKHAKQQAAKHAADQAAIDDDALNADSTTAIESASEPKRDAAKEATP